MNESGANLRKLLVVEDDPGLQAQLMGKSFALELLPQLCRVHGRQQVRPLAPNGVGV